MRKVERVALDETGVVYAEFLIAFAPFFLLFLGIIQLVFIATGSLVVQHAAGKGARAAMVVLPDDPFFYGGEDTLLLDFAGHSDDSAITSGFTGVLDGAGGTGRSATQSSNNRPANGEVGVGGPRLNAIRTATSLVLAPIAPEPSLLMMWLPSGLGLDAILGAAGLRSRASLRKDAIGQNPSTRFFSGLLAYNAMAAAINFPREPGSRELYNQGKEFKGRVRLDPEKPVTVRVTYLLPCVVPIVGRIICQKINPGSTGASLLGSGRRAFQNAKTRLQQSANAASGAVKRVRDSASCVRDEAAGLRDGLRMDATDLKESIVNDVRGLGTGLTGDAEGLRDGLLHDATQLAQGAKGDVSALGGGIVTDGKTVLGGVKKDATDLVNGLKSDGSGLGSGLGHGLSDDAHGLADGLEDDADQLGDGLQNGAHGLGDQLGGLANDVKDTGAACVSPLGEAAKNATVETTDAAGRKVLICLDQAGRKLVSTFDEAGTRVEQTVNQSGELVLTTVDSAGRRVESTVTKTGERIDRTVDEAGNEVQVAVSRAGDRVKTTVDSAGNRVEESLDEQKNRVIKTYDTLGNRVETTIDQAGKRVDNAYDAAGRRIETTYDGAQKRAVAIYEGGIKRAESSFDAVGNCVPGFDDLGTGLTTLSDAIGSDGQSVVDDLTADPELSPEEQALMDELHAGVKQPDWLHSLLSAEAARFYVVRREATLPLQSAPYRYPTWKKFQQEKDADDTNASL